MKTEEINGKLYEVVPETKENSCEGCVFEDSFCIGTGECCNGSIYKEIEDNPEENKLKLKEFNLEAAKAGKPVCTRDGRKARIICFDAKFLKTGNIVTLVEKENGEEGILYHYNDGSCSIGKDYDLMMLPKKKKGYIILYKYLIYKNKEEALKNAADSGEGFIRVQEVEWEE